MSIKIITVGKKHETWTEQGIERYQKRLRAPFAVEWVFLSHSQFSGIKAAEEESQRILDRLKDDEFLLLLDERGKMLSSPALSDVLQSATLNAKVVCVIGGAYGVDERVQKRANLIWSLSDLVFPHQLVRLILVEQLYRAQSIARGEPYHHE